MVSAPVLCETAVVDVQHMHEENMWQQIQACRNELVYANELIAAVLDGKSDAEWKGKLLQLVQSRNLKLRGVSEQLKKR